MNIKKQFSYLASGAFFAFGFTAMIMGSALPAIEASLGINHYLAGILLSVPSLGFAIGAFLVAFISPIIGPFKALFGGIVMLVVSLAGIVLSRSFVPLLISSICMSFSTGMLETSIGVAVSSMRYKKPGKTLNLMHSLFALGAIISPFIVSFFLPKITESTDHAGVGNWWKPFMVSLIIAVGILMYSTSLLKVKFERAEKGNDKAKRYVLKNNIFWLVIIGVFLYVGYEVGLSSWVTSFVFESKGIALKYASIFPSLLWAGLLVGRLISGMIVEKLGYELSLMTMTLISIVGFTLILVFKNPLLISASVFLSGLGFSGTFPTLQAILISKLEKGVSFALAMFTVVASFGASSANYLIGTVGNTFGMLYGIILILGMIIAELFVIFLLMRRNKNV